MLSEATITSRLHTQLLGRVLEYHAHIDSTNTRALALARGGAPEGTVILAEEQTQGRGRLGRRWHAPPDSSLLLSLLLRPPLLPRQAQRITMICSLGAIEAVAHTTSLEAQVKWPNDIVIHGKKLAGVLCELGARGQELAYIVVGMGLNVNLDVAALPELLAPATSLSAELGAPVDRLELLVTLLEAIDRRYARLIAGWSPRDEWRDRLATLGQAVTIRGEGEPITGIAEDVDADGSLCVRTPSGELRTVIAGDVTLRTGHSSSDTNKP